MNLCKLLSKYCYVNIHSEQVLLNIFHLDASDIILEGKMGKRREEKRREGQRKKNITRLIFEEKEMEDDLSGREDDRRGRRKRVRDNLGQLFPEWQQQHLSTH